jgi:hypothetical protein
LVETFADLPPKTGRQRRPRQAQKIADPAQAQPLEFRRKFAIESQSIDF